MLTKREASWIIPFAIIALVILAWCQGVFGQTRVTTEKELHAALTAKQLAEIPAGVTIEIKQTLLIQQCNGGGIRGASAGSIDQTSARGAASGIAWVGASGQPMLVIDRALGLDFASMFFDGRNKALTAVKFIAPDQWGNDHHHFSHVNARRVTGAAFEFGDSASDPNCSDTMFVNCGVKHAAAAVRTLNHQAVNISWLGGMVSGVKKPFDIVRGGNFTATGAHLDAIDCVLFVGDGGPNAGRFSLRDLRMEYSGLTKRYATWIDAPAPGGAAIVMDGCQETDAVLNPALPDNSTEHQFKLGKLATLNCRNHGRRTDRPIVTGEGSFSHDNSAWTPELEVKWTK